MERFHMSDLGAPKLILGMRVIGDRECGTPVIHQTHCIQIIVDEGLQLYSQARLRRRNIVKPVAMTE